VLAGAGSARTWSFLPLFQADFHQYSFLLTNCWIKFIWSFLAYSDLALHVKCPPELGSQWVNDQFLMEIFFSGGQFANKELICINRCPLAKRALMVADLCTSDGTAIWHTSLLPQVVPDPSTLIWQYKQPSQKDWCTWSWALHGVFGPQLILPIPLGVGSGPHTNIQYTSLMTQIMMCFTSLATMTCGGYSGNPPQALVTNSFTHYVYTGAITSVPPSAYHLAFASPGPGQTLHWQGSCPKPLLVIPVDSLVAHICQLWKECTWPLYSSVFPNQGQAITEAIMLGMAHEICNGLYMSETSLEYATAAWLLEDSRFPHQNLCHGIVHVSGITIDINAYQAELQGLHALLLASKASCSYYSVTSGLVLVGCDNLGALNRCNNYRISLHVIPPM